MKMPKPMDESYKLFIDGKWVNGKQGKTFKSFCPSNGELLATCAEAGKEDVDKAVKAAWKAFESWKDVSPQERSRLLLKIADLIDANTENLALVETLDNGKPIRETMTVDVPLASDHFRYFAAALPDGRRAGRDDRQGHLESCPREPIGVVGQIIPWNFPLLMAAWKIAPALAAGDTVVIKPSSATPLSLLELAKLFEQGVAPGGSERHHRSRFDNRQVYAGSPGPAQAGLHRFHRSGLQHCRCSRKETDPGNTGTGR